MGRIHLGLSLIHISLIFSWQATVVAAVVVAFPLMYRSARGAFENLDPNMLDAARTLGWSNRKIFFKLMLPLSWSSIAAGTVLAFARALGEFGATLLDVYKRQTLRDAAARRLRAIPQARVPQYASLARSHEFDAPRRPSLTERNL